MDFDPLLLSRVQFAWVIAWHILLPAFTVGLASFIALLEALHFASGRELYFRLSNFWTRIFAVSFGMGVVSGQIVMASGMANASPVGVRVGVGGTGMSVVVGADGRFAFAGVADGAQLIFERRSEPISRIVCGFPAAAGSMTWLMPVMCAVPLNAATTLSTSCHAATAVAAADATTITNAPSRKRLKTPGPV